MKAIVRGIGYLPYQIRASYNTLEEMVADSANPLIRLGDYALINNNDSPEHGNLYKKADSVVAESSWSFVMNATGPTGKQGIQGEQGNKGDKGEASLTYTTVTLLKENWSDNLQTVSIPLYIKDNANIFSIIEEDIDAAADSVLRPVSSVDGSVTFKVDRTPEQDITLTLLMGEVTAL